MGPTIIHSMNKKLYFHEKKAIEMNMLKKKKILILKIPSFMSKTVVVASYCYAYFSVRKTKIFLCLEHKR
jgi:hypothetical protein